MTFREFIKNTGVSTISGVLGTPAYNIHVWTNRGYIPRRHWPALSIGLSVPIEDFFQMELASKVEVRA